MQAGKNFWFSSLSATKG